MSTNRISSKKKCLKGNPTNKQIDYKLSDNASTSLTLALCSSVHRFIFGRAPSKNIPVSSAATTPTPVAHFSIILISGVTYQ